MARAFRFGFVLPFLLLLSISKISAGVGGLLAGGGAVQGFSGRRLSIPFYVSIHVSVQDNAWVRILPEDVRFERTDGLAVKPNWFENVTISPPLENHVISPYGDVVEANLFMPNLENYIVYSATPPERIPQEIENYVDAYFRLGDCFIPARTVTVSFDVSPSTPRGEYKVYLNATFISAVPQEQVGTFLGAQTCVKSSCLFYIIGPPPPPVPLPIYLTVILIFGTVAGLVVGRHVLKKKKLRI